jgi:cephalosporin hydroxylase
VRGKSLDKHVLAEVGRLVEGAAGGGPVLVILDSDHAEEHVFKVGRAVGVVARRGGGGGGGVA